MYIWLHTETINKIMKSNNNSSVYSNFANLLIPFCESASINYRNTDDTLKKRIMVSFMTFLEPEILISSMFPNEHFDWPNVKQYLQSIQYSTLEWLQLISLMDFSNDLPVNQSTHELLSSALAGITVSIAGKNLTPVESMKLCFAKAGISPTWDVVCKAIILSMISDINLYHCFQFLLSNTPSVEQKHLQDIIQNMSVICKHSNRDYHQLFHYIFHKDNCHVRSHVLIQSLDNRQQSIEQRRKAQLNLIHQSKKPSLTSILENSQQSEALSKSGVLQNTDSFLNFCENVRLPVHLKIYCKKVIYALKCLPESCMSHDIFEASLEKILGNQELPTIIKKLILDTDVVIPDLMALKSFLSETYYTVAPFTSLKLFYKTCIIGGHGNGNNKLMNWTTIFRLYLCIFFKSDVCRELWRYTITLVNENGSISNGIIKYYNIENEKNIETFKEENPVDISQVVSILMLS